LQARGRSFGKSLGYKAGIPRLTILFFKNQDSILNLHQKAHGMMARGPSFRSVLSDTELDRLCGKTHLLVEKCASDSMGLPQRDVDVHSSLRILEPEPVYPSSETSAESNGNIHHLLAEHVQSFILGGRPALGDQSPLFDEAAASNFEQMRCDSLSEGGGGLERYQPSESQSPTQLRVDERVYAGVGDGSGYSTYEQQSRPHVVGGVLLSMPYEQEQLLGGLDPAHWHCLVEQLGFGGGLLNLN